jgi:hypothetical protein
MLSTPNVDGTLAFRDSAMLSHIFTNRSLDTVPIRSLFHDLETSSGQPGIKDSVQSRSTKHHSLKNPMAAQPTTLDTQLAPSKAFYQYTSRNGVVRDGCTITSQLKILYITRDNFFTLLRGLAEDQRKRFISAVNSIMESRCILLKNEQVLCAIEDAWTGDLGVRTDGLNRNKSIYAQFRLSYFIDSWWQQVRELTVLAVSEDAHELLRELIEKTSTRSKFRPLECEQYDIVQILCNEQQLSIKDGFVRCLRRETFSLHFDNAESPLESPGRNKEIFRRAPKVERIKDVNRKSPGVRMHGWVHYIYSQYCIGGREPNESFLRVSSRIQSNNRLGDIKDQANMGVAIVCAPVPENANLPDNSRQLLCLYISCAEQTCHKSASLEPEVIATALIQTLLEQRFYYTTRRGKVLRANRDVNNLESSCFTFPLFANSSWGIEGSLSDAILDWIREICLRVHNPTVPFQDFFMSKRHDGNLLRKWLMSLCSTDIADTEDEDEGMRHHLTTSHAQVCSNVGWKEAFTSKKNVTKFFLEYNPPIGYLQLTARANDASQNCGRNAFATRIQSGPVCRPFLPKHCH